MPEPAVLVEQDGHVLTVTLNRPEKKNAVNAEVLCRLSDAWHRLSEDDDLRAGILTGRGDTFCAGMDLSVIGKLGSGAPPGDEFGKGVTLSLILCVTYTWKCQNNTCERPLLHRRAGAGRTYRPTLIVDPGAGWSQGKKTSPFRGRLCCGGIQDPDTSELLPVGN